MDGAVTNACIFLFSNASVAASSEAMAFVRLGDLPAQRLQNSPLLEPQEDSTCFCSAF